MMVAVVAQTFIFGTRKRLIIPARNVSFKKGGFTAILAIALNISELVIESIKRRNQLT